METTYESDSKISELSCENDSANKGCNFILKKKLNVTVPESTVYGLQFNIDFIENISLKMAYDLGTSFNKNLKGQLLGFDFYKDLSINNWSREYYLENSKYLKKFTTMNIKYFGGLALSY